MAERIDQDQISRPLGKMVSPAWRLRAPLALLRAELAEYWILLLAPFLLLGPILLRGQALFWGTPALQFIPWWQGAFDNLRQGVLPLWNPLNGMGAPLLANYQTAYFYPPNWLVIVLAALVEPEFSAAAIAWGFTVLAALHLAWAGLGMARLLRRLQFGWLAQITGGLAFGLSGYIVARMGFFPMLWVAAWLPWGIYFADQLASPHLEPAAHPAGHTWQRPRLLAGLVAVLAMQLLAGHAQLSWYSLLLALAWVTVGALRWGGWGRLLSVWVSFGLAIGLAAGLAAVQLVPTFEYLQLSHRAEAVDLEVALAYSFWPWRILTIFAPDFFGSPASGDFWGYASYWEDHLYIGMLPILLACYTLGLLLRGVRRARRARTWGLVLFLWGGLLLTFGLALGRYAPIFPFLYHHVPTFAMFQAPARFLLWAALALPLLAAVGVDRWHSPTGRSLYWSRLATAGAFAVTLGAMLAFLLMDNVRLTFIRAAALAGMWALGFGLLTLSERWAAQHRRAAIWRWAAIIWLLADLLITGWSLNPGVALDFYNETQAAAPVEAGQRVYLNPFEHQDLKFTRFFRFTDYAALEDWRVQRDVLLPNLNLLDRVASVNNFDPLVPDGYARWMQVVETLHPQTQAAWLAWAGTGAVEHIDLSQPAGVRFDRLEGAQRWHWVNCARFVGDQEALWQSLTGEMNAPPRPERALIIAGAPPERLAVCQPGPAAAVEWIGERSDRIALRVITTRPGWLQMMHTWYPGWQVTIDGQAAQVFRADGLFLAVEVPAGTHEVVWVYRPAGFYFGGLSSILVLLFLGIRWNNRRVRVRSRAPLVQ